MAGAGGCARTFIRLICSSCHVSMDTERTKLEGAAQVGGAAPRGGSGCVCVC